MKSSRLENAEALEQLRILENGRRIFTIKTQKTFKSVDTMEDLKQVRKMVSDLEETFE